MTTKDMVAASSGSLTKASLDQTRDQLALLEGFVQKVLRPNQDYGKIPGTDKPTLLKPGAANIIAAFNCHVEPMVDSSTVDPQKGFVSYEVHVDVIHNASGNIMARGFAQANSYEEKWRYRYAKPACPKCSREAIIQGKAEYGGGWLCFKKLGGCGAKYEDDDAAITGQRSGRVENENPLSLANTIKKIAIKRAAVDAALQLPGVARFFTQDFDEAAGHQEEDEANDKVQRPKSPQTPSTPADSKDASMEWLKAQLKALGLPTAKETVAFMGRPWPELISGGYAALVDAVTAKRRASPSPEPQPPEPTPQAAPGRNVGASKHAAYPADDDDATG